MSRTSDAGGGPARISVFLADDNLIVREGVRALLGLEPDIEVVGAAEDFDGLVAGAEAANPQVVVTDIRMPPSFQREGIEAAKLVRKRHPGTGIVVLSQFDDPEYAVSLLGEGAAGYAYLLKDRVAEGQQLASAIRTVATGGSMLDPEIVEALVRPVLHRRRSVVGRRGAAAAGRRGQADQGHRRHPADDGGAGGRGRGRPVPPPGRGRQPRLRRRPAPAAHAAPGHRRPRGAGRDAQPPAARRPGREAPQRGPAHRGERAPAGHRADVGHPRLQHHRREGRPRPRWPGSSTSTGRP